MRLIIVSNRLPVTIEEKDGQISVQESVGGLVSGINSYLASLDRAGGESPKHKYKWFGWAGKDLPKSKQNSFRARLIESNLYPLFVPESAMDKFYLGFCNKTIWPLFHYFPSFTAYQEDYWEQYVHVNRIYCEEILKNVDKNDAIWVHDHHLMLLPKMLREHLPDASIGFFLHIPFPSYEIFRLLPGNWRRQLLEGLLGADLIGFHTYEYTRHFLNSVMRILGHENRFGEVAFQERLVKIDSFPMGTEYEAFAKAVTDQETRRERAQLTNQFRGMKIVLSIDRLDYSKGILNRLKGYEVFLRDNPEWHGKIVLLMVVVPSRIGVERYGQMKRDIDERIGRINGSFGTINWTPVIYQYRYVSFKPLAALYSVSDIALVTPLRDGMNLIAKEYLACRPDQSGVLILSEMAGASKELGEALLINPNDVKEIASAIRTASEMSMKEQKSRNDIMQTRLKRYDVIRWADEFLNSLGNVKERQKEWGTKLLDASLQTSMIQKFKKAKKRLLLLDYDGTLVPFVTHPEQAIPPVELMKLIGHLSRAPRTEIFIISGRDRTTLENWFGSLRTGLVAEHGVWFRKNFAWQKTEVSGDDWKSSVLPIMQTFTDRLAGSFIEEKEVCLVWHYRASDPEQSAVIANELTANLTALTAHLNVNVTHGNKIVEVRTSEINKGRIVQQLLDGSHDFVLAVGDDITDEEMFKALPEDACSVKVGMSSSFARYNLPTYQSVRKFIELLANE